MRRLSAFVTVFLLATGALGAQDVRTPEANADSHVKEDYRLGPGDLLTIRIVDVAKHEQIRVSNSGKIHVPHLGIVPVYGMTTGELEASITRGLREKGLIKDPAVQVNIAKAHSKPVYILGEVIIPGQFVLQDEMHVLDLVVLGGGMNELATPQAYLYRRTPVRPDKELVGSYNSTDWSDEVLTIDFERIAAGKDPDVKLQPGDVLYVPERRKLSYYVVGDVAAPGAFPYPQTGSHRMSAVSSIAIRESPLRMSEAVATAGGALRSAKTGSCVIVRFDSTGATREIPFDLSAVMTGREPDILVEPNDIVYIPGSPAKSFAYSILRIVPSMLLWGLVF